MNNEKMLEQLSTMFGAAKQVYKLKESHEFSFYDTLYRCARYYSHYNYDDRFNSSVFDELFNVLNNGEITTDDMDYIINKLYNRYYDFDDMTIPYINNECYGLIGDMIESLESMFENTFFID